MTEDKKFGPISISMRDGNHIEHVGHIVINPEAPPVPGAIIQNGKKVGTASVPLGWDHKETVEIERIFAGPDFDPEREFEVEGAVLSIASIKTSASQSSFGTLVERRLMGVTCRLGRWVSAPPDLGGR